MVLNSVFKVFDIFDWVVWLCYINFNNEEVGVLVNMNICLNNYFICELMYVFIMLFVFFFIKKNV